MHHRLRQPHLPPSNSPTPSDDDDNDAAAKRGNYNRGHCGLPKKGHSCHASSSSVTTASFAWAFAFAVVPSSLSSVAHPPQPPPLLLSHHLISHFCRALLFDVRADEEEEDFDEVEPDLDKQDRDFVDGDADAGGLPAWCLWDVLRRLPSTELLAVVRVCKVWRETSRRVWRAAEDLKLRVPSRA